LDCQHVNKEMTMLSSTLRAKLAIANAQAISPLPPPDRRAVSGFPPHTDRVEGLPSVEQFLISDLVDWVIETHVPGAFPVVGINCIGHADRDDRLGRGYEQDISERRARAVMTALEDGIVRRSWRIAMGLYIPTVWSSIRFTSSGVGSSDAKPAVNEAQRLRNRRVQMIFTRGNPAARAGPPLRYEDLFKGLGLRRLPYPDGPLPRIPYFIDVKYPTRDDWRDLVRAIRKSPLRFVDLKDTIESFVDALDPPHGEAEVHEKWVEDLTDADLEDQRERRKNTEHAPGPDDPDDD
jgi:hypothetical protein